MKRFVSLFFIWLFACMPVFATGDTGLGWRQTGVQAPNDANYIVSSLTDQLSNERALASGTPFLDWNDNGPNGTMELIIASDLAIADGGTGASTAAGALINLIGTPTKGRMLVANGSAWTILEPPVDDGKAILSDSGESLGVRWGDAGASTIDDEQYLVMAFTGDLPNERKATQGTGILINDGGSGGDATFSIDTSVVATLSGSQTLSNKTLSNPIIDSQLTIEKGANDYTVTFSTPAAARIINFPDPGATADVVYSVSAQTIGGIKTFSSAPVLSTGTITVSGNTITFPAATDTVTLLAAAQTLTNKTLTSPSIGTQITLTQSSGNYVVTFNNPAAGRTIKVEDVGGPSAFALKGDGDVYTNGGVPYGNGNLLKFGPAGTDGQWLKKVSGIPTWTDLPAGGVNGVVNCHLSLESGVMYSTTDQSAKTVLYLIGGQCPIYNGSTTSMYAVNGGQVSSGTITVTNALPYDIFAYDSDSGGDVDALSFVAWSNATTRATSLNLISGAAGPYYVNSSNNRTYVGTVLPSATNQISDTKLHRGVYSYGLKKLKLLQYTDTTDSWTYNSTTYRQMNGTGGVKFVLGLTGDLLDATAVCTTTYTASYQAGNVGIGLDSTSTNSAQIQGYSVCYDGNYCIVNQAIYKGYPSVGAHDLYALERIPAGSSNHTFYGDGGTTYFQNGMIGELLMFAPKSNVVPFKKKQVEDYGYENVA